MPGLIDPRRAARLSPSAFARYATKGAFELPPHLRLLERVLVEVAAGRKKRVAVSVPPRHGKSWFCSRFFPAWFLGNFPNKRIILASYEADFAASWGRTVRDLLTEHGPSVFGVTIRQDSHAANRWDIVGREGGMQTAGVGGPVLGKGADLFLIDDAHKNWAEVFSVTIREKIWEWYQSTARSRLEPGAAMVVLQQRWHEEDLMGRLLGLDAQGLERWERIDFPALAESNDILGRRPGDALWPSRFTREDLEAHRRTIHSKFWEAQYQQHPTPLEGGLFLRQHIKRYRIEGDELVFEDYTTARFEDFYRFLTVDTATSTKTSADQTAVASWGVDPRGRLVLLDLDMRRIDGLQVKNAIIAMASRWRSVPWIEDNSTSKHLLSWLEAENVAFRTVEPGSQDKWTRAALHAAAMWERGYVVLPESTHDRTVFPRDFLAAFERQVLTFSPESTEDDGVDCLAYACKIAADHNNPGSGLIAVPSIGGAAKAISGLIQGYGTRRPPGM